MPAPQTPAPKTIGPYRVLRTIARGGMSIVYEVEDPDTHERFALKHLTVDGAIARARFDREYAAMMCLVHDHVGRVFAQGEQDGAPWITLEYLDGLSVAAHVEAAGEPGSPRRTQRAVLAICALAQALAHVHARGLVHRDIKSGNVLVLADGRVKLVDFGIAWVPGSGQEHEQEEFVGTLAYAAPEQFRGETPTASSDLYSVGCLLYRLLTGQRPFTGSSPAEMAKLHIQRSPQRPRSLVPELPASLERIVLRLMKKTADARIPSADALASLLGEWLDTQELLPVAVALDRGARRGIGREAELERLLREIATAPAGSVLTLRGLRGSRHNHLLDLLVDDARARSAAAIRITHTDTDRFSQLQAAGNTRQRALVAVVDVHLWDSGTSRALERAIDAASEHGDGAVFVASMALESSDLATDLLIERASVDVVLTPLDLSATRRLVGALLQRHPPPSASARAIHAATDGVPSYVEEIVGRMIADGELPEVTAGQATVAWPWRPADEVPVPEGATWTVDQALTNLDITGLRLVEALAATRAPASVDQLIGLIDLDVANRSMTLIRMASTGLVRVDDDMLDWTRPVAARLVRERTPGPRARTLARRALSSDIVFSPAEQVRLALTAKRIESALAPAHTEGQTHLKRGAPASALDLVEPVYEQLDEVHGMQRDQAMVRLVFAAALQQLRPADPRIPVALTQAIRDNQAPEHLAEAALITAKVQRSLARNDDARHKLGEAWLHASQSTSRRLSVEIAHEAGTAYIDAGHIAWGQRWFERCRRAAATAMDTRVRALAALSQALVAWRSADLAQTESIVAEAMRPLAARPDARALSLAVPLMVHTLRIQGRYTEALDWLRRHTSAVQIAEAPLFAVVLHLSRAELELDLGRLGWAQDCLEQARAGMAGGDDLQVRLSTEQLQARVWIGTGQHTRAREHLEHLVHRARRAGLVLLARRTSATLAEALAACGEPTRATDRFDEILSETEGSGDAMTLIEVRRAQLRSMADLIDPVHIASAIRGWPGLPLARAVQLDIALARHRWCTSQILDCSEPAQAVADAADAVLSSLEGPERAAVRLRLPATAVQGASRRT